MEPSESYTNWHSTKRFRGRTLLLELDFAEQNLNYKPGDHLGVFACNQTFLVDGILQKLDNTFGEDMPIEMQIQKQIHTPNGTYNVIYISNIILIRNEFFNLTAQRNMLFFRPNNTKSTLGYKNKSLFIQVKLCRVKLLANWAKAFSFARRVRARNEGEWKRKRGAILSE